MVTESLIVGRIVCMSSARGEARARVELYLKSWMRRLTRPTRSLKIKVGGNVLGDLSLGG